MTTLVTPGTPESALRERLGFELILLVEEVTPEQEDAIYGAYDALAGSHTGSTRLTVTAEGATATEAALGLLGFLRSIDVRPIRFCEDFVTRADIAERAGVSRQAVGLWVRGERKSAFPESYSPVAGGIWLFGEVDCWLRANVSGYVGDDLSYPTRADHIALAGMTSLAESPQG